MQHECAVNLKTCCWRCRDSIDMDKPPVKSKHVTIETMETLDTDVGDDAGGIVAVEFGIAPTTRILLLRSDICRRLCIM